MRAQVSFDKSLIAPCGMNCGTCIAYLRDKNKCPGCPEAGQALHIAGPLAQIYHASGLSHRSWYIKFHLDKIVSLFTGAQPPRDDKKILVLTETFLCN